ncbi:MAG: 1-acyl-sn-glycerol-3-phosphate acyltransferase [Candidatus Dadabacteria bacterium]|nr:1-acyl-sn-glycerol-3-phosphate acyltransferase [Candidatus Dadabacteria bacterium]NIV41474.1 hypothetical protein [Candidatus Dadabacteria bacterium]NIX15670.1 hypothetical protein [Candidatus Dadabacteria bacterium]
MFNTIKAVLTISFATIFFGIIAFILSLRKSSRTIDYIKYTGRPWGKCVLKGCGVNLIVEGTENLPQKPCIIMYNHSSFFDIAAFCASMPIEWRAIVKKELAKVPIVGFVCRVSGQYFVARDGSADDLQKVKEIAEKIKSGPSVLVAPEGTRSKDGNLLPFKKGGFVIALRAKVPVVTMVITGGRFIRPKNSRMFHPGEMKIKIFEPISVDKLGKGREGREKLEKLVREQMESVLREQQNLKVAA